MLAPTASIGPTRVPYRPIPPANHGYRVGHIQRQVRREFILSDGRPLSTGELIRRAYPHLRIFASWHYREVRRAARRWGVPIGGGRGRNGILWAPIPPDAKTEG